VTFTVIVQLLEAGIVPLLRVRLELPAVAVTVPPHVLARPFGLATVMPEGKLSTSAAEVIAVGVVFVKVSVN
jgi:hypothetical protein